MMDREYEISFAAEVFQANCLARACPRAISFSRSPVPWHTVSSASTWQQTASGGIKTAASPAVSGIAVPLLATTGAPHAMASKIGTPKPSYFDGNHTALAP